MAPYLFGKVLHFRFETAPYKNRPRWSELSGEHPKYVFYPVAANSQLYWLAGGPLSHFGGMDSGVVFSPTDYSHYGFKQSEISQFLNENGVSVGWGAKAKPVISSTQPPYKKPLTIERQDTVVNAVTTELSRLAKSAAKQFEPAAAAPTEAGLNKKSKLTKTELKLKAENAVHEHGSIAAAARALGKDRRTVKEWLGNPRRKPMKTVNSLTGWTSRVVRQK